jgi:hypothetical protein
MIPYTSLFVKLFLLVLLGATGRSDKEKQVSNAFKARYAVSVFFGLRDRLRRISC